MTHTQLSQHNVSKTHNQTELGAQTSEPVEDILIRMDRLRALAKLQNNKANSVRRRQFSFAF